jgi:hypothetical protein
MIADEFDRRILANMEVALEWVCQLHPDRFAGHDARKRVAAAIVESARSGKTSLGQFTLVANRVAAQLKPAVPSHPKRQS